MISFSSADVAAYYAARVLALRQRGKRWHGRCPIHRGKRDSFSVDPETGLWRCWSQCGRGGDIITLEMELTCATWRDAVAETERIIGRVLLDRPATRRERRALAQGREREQREMPSAEYFRIAAVRVLERLLDDVFPEAVPERYAPTQLRLALRADGVALPAIYRDFRAREPRLTAALVHAGERAWRRLCTRLARFVAAGIEVPHVV
jgi:hypothetical protein